MDPRSSAPHDEAEALRALTPSADGPRSGHVAEAFDPDQLEKTSWTAAVADRLLSNPRLLAWAAQIASFVLNIVPIGSWAVVWRYDQVRAVLSNDTHFPVAWGGRMIEVTQGRNFVLGMPRDEAYRLSYEQLAQAFPLEDVGQHVTARAADATAKVLSEIKSAPSHEFDAVQDVITAVPTALCESYFGVVTHDKPLFAKWTLAISSYLFGPSTSADGVRLATAAAACLRKAIRDSIASARRDPQQGIVLPRMLEMLKDEDPKIADDTIHAQLFGMVMGFVPTNVLAGGNILETLLRHPDYMERARAAAHVDDDALLWRCLREALRFRHINPGPWRICPGGYVLDEGGPSQIRIRPGSKVLAIIQTAMFDPQRVERPRIFDPERRDEAYMVFGAGQHWCLGAYIAQAQITQTFKPLLRLKRLEAVRNRAVRTKRFNNIFPLHLTVGFEA